MDKRYNREMDDAVVQGVLIDTIRGAARAWAFMRSQAVPESVIFRVLSCPAQRRCDGAANLPADNHL